MTTLQAIFFLALFLEDGPARERQAQIWPIKRSIDHGFPRMGDSRDTIESCVEIVVTMPKLKSRKAAAKRFRRSGSGKIMRRKAFKNHLLQHKNAKQRSRLSKAVVVSEEDAPNVELMLPYL